MKPVRLTRQQSKEATKERLLEAAHILFLQQGIAGATIEQITADAGFTRGAFYSNFDGKEAVLLELLARNGREMTSEARHIAEVGGDPALMRIAIMNYYKKLFYQNDAFILWAEARILAFRDDRFRANFNTLIRNELTQIIEILNQFAAKANIVLPAPSPNLAFGLASLFEGIQANKISNPQHISDEMAESVMAHFLSSALFPTP